VVMVNPRDTSRECPGCGHISKRNRPKRDEFRCERCGLSGPADTIAARNISGRAAVMRPDAARAWSPAMRRDPQASLQGKVMTVSGIRPVSGVHFPSVLPTSADLAGEARCQGSARSEAEGREGRRPQRP
jgi:hypothetical protein